MSLQHKLSGEHSKIHALAHIHPKARIGKNVTIEPFCNIQDDVIIGDNTWIGSNVTIMAGSRIGKNCGIFHGAIVGTIPMDKKFNGERTLIEIHDNVIIREYSTISRGTKASYKTVIGEGALIMAKVHVAHDCVVGKHAILANNVNLAGHIDVGDYAILGGLVQVHQFVRIGAHVIISGGSLVLKDVPPYLKAARDPLSYVGINSVGLRRRGFSKEEIHHIQDIYRYIFNSGMNISQGVKYVQENIAPSDYTDTILEFIKSSKRGLLRGYRSTNGNKAR